jgi:hypothetical protein
MYFKKPGDLVDRDVGVLLAGPQSACLDGLTQEEEPHWMPTSRL